ncbi:MAG: hypothetical protein GX434_02055 [Peptococcaceae bacterium]|nr:hypothetical protein [Peptococcaceae bacterium]
MDVLLQLIRSDDINLRYLSKVQDELNYFLEGKAVDDHIVPKEIIESWNRSRAYGVDPYDQNPYILDPITKMNHKNLEEFIRKYEAFFQNTSGLFEFNDFVFSITDKDGVNQIILNKTGYNLPNSMAQLSEKLAGTTSCAISFWENKPKVIFQPFYYRQSYMQKNFGKLHGASAPIHNDKNEVIGTLGIGFYYPEQALQAYCAISLLTKMFDSLYVPMANGYEKHIQQILDCLPQGIICLNEKDTVKYYNEKVLNLLEINRKQSIENQLNKHLCKLGVGINFKNEKFKIKIDGKEIEAQSICNGIKDEINGRTYRLIQLEEKKSRTNIVTGI